MQFIGFALSAILIFGGAMLYDNPAVFVSFVGAYPREVILGLSVLGVFVFYLTRKMGDYKLSAESKEAVIAGLTGKSIEDYKGND